MNKNFGLNSDQYEILKSEIVKLLKGKISYKVFVFGSRTKGTEKKYSDIDLWIESVPPLNSSEISDFLEDVELSDLVIKLDLVTPETCLEEYKARIMSEKVLWFVG
ncbi:nucleotidyltransferase domain-containing protein [bacterium]|nr:nucleotidyltransferase domain-containing protein [bacterium]